MFGNYSPVNCYALLRDLDRGVTVKEFAVASFGGSSLIKRIVLALRLEDLVQAGFVEKVRVVVNRRSSYFFYRALEIPEVVD